MKKLLVLLLTMVTFFEVSHCEEEQSNYFVDNFLKYSTFYTSVSAQSPFEPKQKFDFDQEQRKFACFLSIIFCKILIPSKHGKHM